MNPFDLLGPEFLLFYFVLSLVVIGALVLWQRLFESTGAPRIDLADPYLIAYLRGGEREALCVALVSLIDRGLLIVKDTTIKRDFTAGPHSVRRAIEKAMLETYAKPGTTASIFEDSKLKAICEQLRETLERNELLANYSVGQARTMRLIFACCLLGGVGVIKIMVALDRGRTNVGFLVILMIIALIVAYKLGAPRLTARGADLLADVQNLYAGLRDRATSIRPGGATIDAMMLAAVFGTAALAGDGFAYTRKLFPHATASSSSSWGSSSCGSSCSSGSSCGSSCGGGGCGGGCGGCGG